MIIKCSYGYKGSVWDVMGYEKRMVVIKGILWDTFTNTKMKYRLATGEKNHLKF